MFNHSLSSQSDSERGVPEAALDARITDALHTGPDLRIPIDFAARVASRAATESVTVSHHYTRNYGRNAAIVSMCVLLMLILQFAHRGTSSMLLWTTIETIFCLQFALLAVWLGARDVRAYLPHLD